ncbi:DUF262 domain-containing protein [Xanthomonas nasturtii]|uniref:DUF262 domain-containing protein n=1 Tax=Xanthomonas nasturtii TaxID=1843581 RepID=A0A3E1KEJ0_9XANT|nr:DUF262 domain-containing protein [Xanthomonas nasturtii]MCL1532388.1 DUF262 domain-containing protein [Xanthomonas nasturtii]MCL1567152.1 DUF262 domain-containing protein [Xanthomonas nasturtii]MCL1570974.1 DUF262 domain-containing protein [Xanthomonas nasturtii]MCL1574743.1 DUF262 domain-containing protein [Xanthomonas nasturtii]MCL1582505.1 DUF262 domain-containing protein [Xanthomonas nasturtii]
MTTILEEEIDSKIGEVRTDSVDFSVGEIASLHSERELIIQPEYQRLFRWSLEQKSRLIESLLLELPIPQIFVIENQDGVFELIDGLQRVSSVLQFMQPKSLGLEPFKLSGCDVIKSLNGSSYTDLPMSLRLRLKRSALKTVVIKRQSKSFLRYEMFKRLNTGGSELAPQEIRNCSVRMLGENGVQFYTMLMDLAADNNFSATISTLSSADLEQKANEELVLRFFAAKNYRKMFRGSVRDWLDDYMESILLGFEDFNTEEQSKEFIATFKIIREIFGETAFVKFRGGTPIGGLAPAYFEAIAIGTYEAYSNNLIDMKIKYKDKIVETVQSKEFREVTGPGANSKSKLETRIRLINECYKK